MIANRWNFNICFHIWGSFHLVFAVRAPKKRCDYFWPVFWPENAFSPFSYTGGLLVCKNEKLNCFDIQSVVEASSFSLNHNMTLESKENYPRHTKIVQNSLGFMPEVKPLHKQTAWWFGVVRPLPDIAANARPLRAWFCHTCLYRFTRAKTFAVTRQIRHTFACVSCYCATFRLLFNHARRGRALAPISGKVPSMSGVCPQNSKYKLEGKILHQQCNRLFPARCQTYAN